MLKEALQKRKSLLLLLLLLLLQLLLLLILLLLLLLLHLLLPLEETFTHFYPSFGFLKTCIGYFVNLGTLAMPSLVCSVFLLPFIDAFQCVCNITEQSLYFMLSYCLPSIKRATTDGLAMGLVTTLHFFIPSNEAKVLQATADSGPPHPVPRSVLDGRVEAIRQKDQQPNLWVSAIGHRRRGSEIRRIKLFSNNCFPKLHFTWQIFIGLFLAMAAVLKLAGDFKEIRATVELSLKSWENARYVHGFLIMTLPPWVLLLRLCVHPGIDPASTASTTGAGPCTQTTNPRRSKI